MVTFSHFRSKCKMRHDYSDQIQVRYQHDDGEAYDAWVSGSEVLGRLRSEVTEEQIKALGRLNKDQLRIVVDSLPQLAETLARKSMRDFLANHLENAIGGNVIGDAMSGSVRGRPAANEPPGSDGQRWQVLLQYEPFRQKVLELVWIQLEGSFPDSEPDPEPDDWL